MRTLFLFEFAGVRRISMIECLTINVLGVRGQMSAHGMRQVGVGLIRHRVHPGFEELYDRRG